MTNRILIWDVPTRVFHWLQALAFLGAYLTSDSGRYRDIHIAMGYIMLGLLIFRLLWGFAGTRYARFSSFLFMPRKVIEYLGSLIKKNPIHYLGHNPAGSVAVWLLLLVGLLLNISGVFALQDYASDEVIELHEVATDIMLVLIAIHILGVFVSSFLHRENLVRAMITGTKPSDTDTGIQSTHLWLGVAIFVISVVFYFIYLGS